MSTPRACRPTKRLSPTLGRSTLHTSLRRFGLSSDEGADVTKSSTTIRGIQFLLAGIALMSALLASAAPAQAEATVSRFSGAHTETFTAPLEGCLPEDLVGTVTVTETFYGQAVDTGNHVFTIHFVNEFDYRLDLPDGSYVQSGLNRDIFTFVFNGSHTVQNAVTQDLRTIYAADGTPAGTLSIHAGFHITYNDLNGNFTPDPGEIAAEFGYFRLRCG